MLLQHALAVYALPQKLNKLLHRRADWAWLVRGCPGGSASGGGVCHPGRNGGWSHLRRQVQVRGALGAGVASYSNTGHGGACCFKTCQYAWCCCIMWILWHMTLGTAAKRNEHRLGGSEEARILKERGV